jgi:peptidyl-prolyl cis-trans isomerase SurA
MTLSNNIFKTVGKRPASPYSLMPLKNNVFLYFFLLLLSYPHTGHSMELLDKTVLVYDNQVVTLTELQEIQFNTKARRSISPMIYNKEIFSTKELLHIILQTYLIRDKLAELGLKISDEQVEEQIRSTEERLHIKRDALLQFLQSNKMTYKEYFELIRESIEMNLIKSKMIYPLVSLSDQQIKEYFYLKGKQSKSVSFRYDLILYKIKKPTQGIEKNYLLDAIAQYHQKNILQEAIKTLESEDLGHLTEEGLSQDYLDILKDTAESSFSTPIERDGYYVVFFVRKKELSESESYSKVKEQIKSILYEQESQKILENWLGKEESKHFIKIFI